MWSLRLIMAKNFILVQVSPMAAVAGMAQPYSYEVDFVARFKSHNRDEVPIAFVLKTAQD